MDGSGLALGRRGGLDQIGQLGGREAEAAVLLLGRAPGGRAFLGHADQHDAAPPLPLDAAVGLGNLVFALPFPELNPRDVVLSGPGAQPRLEIGGELPKDGGRRDQRLAGSELRTGGISGSLETPPVGTIGARVGHQLLSFGSVRQ